MADNIIGNPNKDCANPLLEDSITITLAPSSASSVSYTVPTNRGNVTALEVYVNGEDSAELILARVQVAANKIELLSESPLIKHSSLYENSKKPIICNIPEQAILTFSGINDSTTETFTVTLVMLHYDPYVVSLKSIIN